MARGRKVRIEDIEKNILINFLNYIMPEEVKSLMKVNGYKIKSVYSNIYELNSRANPIREYDYPYLSTRNIFIVQRDKDNPNEVYIYHLGLTGKDYINNLNSIGLYKVTVDSKWNIVDIDNRSMYIGFLNSNFGNLPEDNRKKLYNNKINNFILDLRDLKDDYIININVNNNQLLKDPFIPKFKELYNLLIDNRDKIIEFMDNIFKKDNSKVYLILYPYGLETNGWENSLIEISINKNPDELGDRIKFNIYKFGFYYDFKKADNYKIYMFNKTENPNVINFFNSLHLIKDKDTMIEIIKEYKDKLQNKINEIEDENKKRIIKDTIEFEFTKMYYKLQSILHNGLLRFKDKVKNFTLLQSDNMFYTFKYNMFKDKYRFTGFKSEDSMKTYISKTINVRETKNIPNNYIDLFKNLINAKSNIHKDIENLIRNIVEPVLGIKISDNEINEFKKEGIDKLINYMKRNDTINNYIGKYVKDIFNNLKC